MCYGKEPNWINKSSEIARHTSQKMHNTQVHTYTRKYDKGSYICWSLRLPNGLHKWYNLKKEIVSVSSYFPFFTPSSAAAAAKSLQSCPTLCDPIDGSPPGSPVPGILQAITLEWVAISFSNAWTWKWVPYRLSGGLPLGAGGVDLS